MPLLAKGGFYHAGQVCVSVQRVFADRRIAVELADRLAASASKLRVGDPTLPETEVGPLIRPSEVTRVGQWVDEAVKKGAKKLCGGRALSETTYAPTVLLDPPDDARVSTHEVFGPVVCVYPTTSWTTPSAARTRSPSPSKPPSSRATSIPRSPPPAASTPAPS